MLHSEQTKRVTLPGVPFCFISGEKSRYDPEKKQPFWDIRLYLAKPFFLPELAARVSAVIRRRHFNGSNRISFHEITVDLLGKTLHVNQKPVELTRKEYDLLVFLLANRNRVVSKNAIAEHLSGDDAELLDKFDFIYTHMKNLKRKLADAGSADYIKTVYGLGYKFTE